mmetsp:Transcript_4626/g.8147  ORF Transcript_4626/g.8147 Transcript_4626/m.8147 type:complete len:102 (+) Transcript_4626:8006-8311(+)|eukprot:CAMPEP_0203759620 /NCGR_PEP_ID=MMETSP0098-20131031/12722_1 /ASSEMBLY_ACC=CAM_ASM_000208 /TAXON_ID=96639 /ORGANISM=" , Strain NY0313808BC1" /LENGTH=101 /DNA_ID=CAMNT_0050652709 /DNA_START=235 /DNA_END=540 /DNA_ORIENTATION=-
MEPLSSSEMNEAFELLPCIGEILQQVIEASSKPQTGTVRPDISSKVLELKAKMSRAEALLEKIPGGDMSKNVQKEQEVELGKVLEKKRRFLEAFVPESEQS